MKSITNDIYRAFARFVLAPEACATCPDVCLTNNNTIQGDDALVSLTIDTDNRRSDRSVTPQQVSRWPQHRWRQRCAF